MRLLRQHRAAYPDGREPPRAQRAARHTGGIAIVALGPGDDTLSELVGVDLRSQVDTAVGYRLVAPLGEGGLSVAFLASRHTPLGESQVVVKVLRPSLVRRSAPLASIAVTKEVVALGRLNERVPATPFVVRYVDTGAVGVAQEGRTLELPWIAVELVHGGVEGTTLTERVDRSVRTTGHAFDVTRASRAVDCIAQGLTAVHEVGVIHRDIKPDNVLCCGLGEDELFKVADFGVARPSGVPGTFGGDFLGTPGYAAPELFGIDPGIVSAAADVFAFAGVVHFVLTGEPYFQPKNEIDALVLTQSPQRRALVGARSLAPELRERIATCREIDAALAHATAFAPGERASLAELGAAVLSALRSESRRARVRHAGGGRVRPGATAPGEHLESAWSWTVRQRPSAARVIRSVAWDGDGRCVAATAAGLAFWNGFAWCDAPVAGLPSPAGIRFVSRIGPGRWLVGGDGATFAVYTPDGVTEVVRAADPSVRFDLFSGDLEDLAVLVGVEPAGAATLYALSGRRWLKALQPALGSIASIARIEDARWLIAGRAPDGTGAVAKYAPLDWEVEILAAPATVTSYTSSAGVADQGLGLAVGTQGAVVRLEAGAAIAERIEGAETLTAAGMDSSGRCWAGGASRLWVRDPGAADREGWRLAWSDPTWSAPFVSLFPDAGMIVAVSADGGVLEGRASAAP